MIAEKTSVTVTRRIRARAETLYAAWTDPKQLALWWAPRSVDVVDVVSEARVGGPWRVLMRGADGQTYEVGGEYRTLIPPSKLVFTWLWQGEGLPPSLVTVLLKPAGAATDVTITHEDTAGGTGRDDGWTKSLFRLEREFADAAEG